MKKYLLILLAFTSLSTSAQIFADGTIINGFTATDINNNLFSSTMTTNAGKHFIIDISATWCGNCWNYHNTKVLNDYYAAYGPNGTQSQDAEVLFYEGDASTNINDLDGVGTNTVGDWVMGTNYLLFNESNPSTVKSRFANNGALGYPSVFLVTPDNKMYKIPTSMTDVNDLRDFVNDKLGAPSSVRTIPATSFAYQVYPNPTVGNISVALNITKQALGSYALYNGLGQKVLEKHRKYQSGKTRLELNTAALPSGLYILSITIGDEGITQKVRLD